MDKRTILAIVLSLIVITVYQIYFLKTTAKKQVTSQPKNAAENVIKGTPAVPDTAVKKESPQASLRYSKPEISEREILVDTPLYRAVFTTYGGALKSLQLKKYRKSLAENSDLVEMVQVRSGMPLPLQVSLPNSGIDIPLNTPFETGVDSEIKVFDQERTLSFYKEIPGVIKVEKLFTFRPGQYNIDLEVRVTNLSSTPLTQDVGLTWIQFADPEGKKEDYAHQGPIVHSIKNVERQEIKKLEETKIHGPGINWCGFESKYFIAAMIPSNPTLANAVFHKNSNNLIYVSLITPKNIVPPGQAISVPYNLYIGPKDYSILKAQGVQLEEAIDFGSWLKWLAMPLLITLKFLYGYVHNYGVAIIILTVIIKIIFWPLGTKSYESMKEMQKIQPKLKELQERYKNDRQRLSQETMALYRAHKINPMGGCLPILIQIPVFFGLYKTLLYAIELRHSPFILWIKDLSDKDPYYITPVIMGATMWWQQKMTPTGGDPTQQKIMLWMPVIFTFLFLNFPSGLVIYWLFNNILSIGQQYYINKRFK
ncbi:MAG: membrane protein insertase YidC [Syntrophales bacterium]|nr:membrane protein insertase YidC [Syntrophales bacterium]